MATVRQGEAGGAVFDRSRRIYVADNLWWFDTREGVQFGPFICRIAATCALAIYVAQHAHEARSRLDKISPPGEQDSITHMVDEVVEVLRQQRDFGITAATNWAKWRLEELRNATNPTSEVIGRVRVLEFCLRHPKQAFNFEYFLKCRVG